MNGRRRKLIVSRVVFGTTVAGQCSVCHTPFEVHPGQHEVLSEAKERLVALFDQHSCGEDVDQLTSDKTA